MIQKIYGWTKALIHSVHDVCKSVYHVVKDKLKGLFTARGMLEIVTASAIVTASPLIAHAVSVMPYTDIPRTTWGQLILTPLLFTIVSVIGLWSAEILIPITFIGIRYLNDEFIRRLDRKLEEIDNAEENLGSSGNGSGSVRDAHHQVVPEAHDCAQCA